MKPIYFSIKTKIVFITVLIMVFAVGASTLMGSRILVQGYSSALQSETLSLGQGLTFQLDRLLKLGLEIGDIVGFERQCRETVDKYDNISYAMVLNLDGNVLFHSDVTMHGTKVTDTAILKAVKSKKNIIQPYLVQGVKYYDHTIPVLGRHGEHVGAVRIGFPEKIIAHKIARLFAYTVGVALIAIGLSVGLSIFALSVWVTNPINKLIAVIQDIRTEGTDLTKRVEIQSQDEIGVLAASFNQMIGDLRKTTVSKDYVDNIIQSMTEALIVLTSEGKIKTANPAVCELLGYKPREIIDCPIDKIICDNGQKPFQETGLQELKKKGSISEIEKVYLTKNGVRIPMLFSGSVMRDNTGKIQGIICIASNISKLKGVQEKLRQSYEELKQTQNKLIQSGKLASIGELSAGVAHELNQPLMVIRTTAQLMLRKQGKNALDTVKLVENLNSIERNTKRMMNIINHLRAFSRQTQGELMPVNVNNILQDSFLMIGEQLSLKNIEVKQVFSGGLPKVLGNTNQLEQVFLNLLTNARDAIESKFEAQEGGAELQKRVVISTHVSGDVKDKVEILFKDTGSGILQEAQKNIFDPFYTTKEVGKGTGLGLSISYGIIKDHKGEIDVADTGPEGTTVRIRLPVA